MMAAELTGILTAACNAVKFGILTAFWAGGLVAIPQFEDSIQAGIIIREVQVELFSWKFHLHILH